MTRTEGPFHWYLPQFRKGIFRYLPKLRRTVLLEGVQEADGPIVWDENPFRVAIPNRDSRAMILIYWGVPVAEVDENGIITIKDARWSRLGGYIRTALGKSTS